jgi:hypothetical protein
MLPLKYAVPFAHALLLAVRIAPWECLLIRPSEDGTSGFVRKVTC